MYGIPGRVLSGTRAAAMEEKSPALGCGSEKNGKLDIRSRSDVFSDIDRPSRDDILTISAM